MDPGGRMRIWIIDDNPDDRLLLVRRLRTAFPDAEFREIRSAAEFEEALATAPPDVVLTDYRLFWATGLEVLEALKARLPYLPVLMVTDTGSEEVAAQGMKQGLADYVLKQHPARLPVAIEEALAKARLRRERDQALQELARSEARHRAIAELISDMAYEAQLEPEGGLRYLWLSGAFLRILGLERTTLNEAGGLEPWVVPEDRPLWRAHLERLRAGQESVCQLRLLAQDGSVRWIRDYARPAAAADSDGSERIYGAAQDITQQCRALEAEQEARRQAEEISQLKSAFLASMSHEIRTPMNGILGFAELLREELEVLKRPDLVEFVDIIQRSGQRLLRLLDDILDLSRIEAGKVQVDIRPVRLLPLVEQALATFRAQAHKKGLRFSCQVPADLFLAADEQRLYQVLLNVISNAVKFTEAGWIHVLARRKADHVLIQVQDTGIGIEAAFLSRIFEPFAQESTGWERRAEGSGLGLSITKRLVELMEGSIEVRSRKGEGTTVEIRLPAAQAPQESVSDVERQGPDPEHVALLRGLLPRIWLIEDHPESARFVEEALRGLVRLQWAPSGEEAMRLCQEAQARGERPDVVLLDLHLPHPWEGRVLRDALRARWPALLAVPFIAQTAYATDQDREQIQKAAFEGYLPKPITREALLRTLWEVLREKTSSS